MSGIFGFFKSDLNYNKELDELFNYMSSWNKAYGNSLNDSFISSDFFIGCYLEKLNSNLSDGKPILKNKNKIAVIDSVLYNRDEIALKINLELSNNISDEELLFKYIIELGLDALKDVNGDFAGAIYDRQNDNLILFRDHMGIRPLFYYSDNKMLAFSTDIRGITAIPDVDASINEKWFYKFICGHFLDGLENTEYKNIKCIKPGTYVTFSKSDGQLIKSLNTYWEAGTKKIKFSSDQAYQNEMRFLVEDSVKRRLDAISGTIGAELSGGLDSSVIDIIINRFGRKGIYFSWSESPEEQDLVENDERLVISDICKQENITCHYGHLDMGRGTAIDKNTKDAGIELNYDEYEMFRLACPPYINTNMLIQSAEFINKAGGNVVFSGHGGDEGVSHRANPYEMFHYKEYYHYFRYMFSTTHYYRNRVILTLKKCFENFKLARRVFLKPRVFDIGSIQVLNKDFANKYNLKDLPISYFAYDPISYINSGGSRSRLDVASFVGAYCKTRYIFPFLDYRVIDYAVSIPRYQYLRGRKNRYIYREAFKEIIPDSLYRLHDKQDPSFQVQKETPDCFEKDIKLWKEAVSKLDRDVWNKFLNFEYLDRISLMQDPKEIGEGEFSNCLFLIFVCAMVQNMVQKSREVNR